jgi:hypothetical protein
MSTIKTLFLVLVLSGCGRESATLAGASSDCVRLAAAAESAAFSASATFEKRYAETTAVFRYRVAVASRKARLFDVTQQPFATEVAIGAGGRSFQGDGCGVYLAADGSVTVTN